MTSTPTVTAAPPTPTAASGAQASVCRWAATARQPRYEEEFPLRPGEILNRQVHTFVPRCVFRGPRSSTRFARRTTPRSCATRKPAARAVLWIRTVSGNPATRSASRYQVTAASRRSLRRRWRSTHRLNPLSQKTCAGRAGTWSGTPA